MAEWGRPPELKPLHLPPPMIPGNNDAPSSVCAMQVGACWAVPRLAGVACLLPCAGLGMVAWRPSTCCVPPCPHPPARFTPRPRSFPRLPVVLQEDFEKVAKSTSGFKYMAERPEGDTFVEQKVGGGWQAWCRRSQLRFSSAGVGAPMAGAAMHCLLLLQVAGWMCLEPPCSCLPCLQHGAAPRSGP